MTEEERRRFESLFQLYESAWGQFNERRRFEFKVTLTFWTALAAGIAGSMTLAVFPSMPGGKLLLCLVALAGVGLHALWCHGIGNAQRADRFVALSYEPELQKLVQGEFSASLKNELEQLQRAMGRLRNWTYVFQLGVTLLLAVTLVGTNWSKFDESGPTVRQLERRKLELDIQELQQRLEQARGDAAPPARR